MKPQPKADVKRAARSKRSSLTRLRPFWFAGVIVAGLAAWGGVWLAENPAFALKRLDVSGLSHVTRAEVVARAAIDPHRNIWLLDVRAIEARLDALPHVRTARVHRRPPATIRLEIAERVPSACVRAGTSAALIDADDRVLELGCHGDVPAYVLDATHALAPGAFLHDEELTQLEADARALGAGARFVSFAHDRFGELVATRSDGIAVQFGDEDQLERKQRLVGPILAELGPQAAGVASVDVRTPATPVVEYRPEPPAMHRSPQAPDSQ